MSDQFANTQNSGYRFSVPALLAEVERCEGNLEWLANALDAQAKAALATSPWPDACRDASALINRLWTMLGDAADQSIKEAMGV